MKKLFCIALTAIFLMTVPVVAFSQQKQIKMPTEHNEGVRYSDYTTYERGFFCAAEAGAAYMIESVQKPVISEIDFVGGYRYNEFFRAGIGIGVRHFAEAGKVRHAPGRFGMPLYLDIRGNFIPTAYRDVVPYYSFDIGTSFPDGMMIRPGVGLRIGQDRSAFLVSLSYLGQDIRTINSDGKIDRKFMSGISLKVGYEF
ncbi:MAG: hypothetical protein NC207_00625 [Bacteroides sp.]|nr:hypothetical protein [Bacteroides sp.]